MPHLNVVVGDASLIFGLPNRTAAVDGCVRGEANRKHPKTTLALESVEPKVDAQGRD